MLHQQPRSPLFPYTTLFRSSLAPIDELATSAAISGKPAGNIAYPGSVTSSARSQAVTDLVGRDAELQRLDELTDNLASSGGARSEEHTSELQSHVNLVCRLL